MRVLITGAEGQLGSEFTKFWKGKSLSLGHKQLDITNFQSVRSAVREFCNEGDIIINCAAYNKVDLAETDCDAAVSVNVIGPRNLAVAANDRNCKLMHFSTDYVFDGLKRSGYSIADATNPLSWYGQTKLQGEREVARYHNLFYIVRLSSVFGMSGPNFVTRIKETAASQRRVQMTNTQVSSIAYTADLVPALFDMVRHEPYGVYHLANSGFCNRLDWAVHIVKSIQVEIPVDVNNLIGGGARRPAFSGLACFPLPPLPHWTDATERYLRTLDA